jgi:hypothetical protein
MESPTLSVMHSIKYIFAFFFDKEKLSLKVIEINGYSLHSLVLHKISLQLMHN